ncbi:aromatic ring-hydroxylating dioxygenase subunit alpha [Aurantiacibacter xanthus]|uniref:Aromatic ring-hydroxylating dioxygenase subunit alpha n=1 Tax=Aurantiacibacter xanthus TaxID=1784712 RepID=A0A3A1P306_9SPHN|nr:aromatic ring-hydroxylating dioxygenase subunit alpha [Aurantiacibacter xanthus]RIV82237.1 aromatic ring-hydroxylating dioxygenase subunit alpha [Aurantiacibacter xanthus]
MGYLRNCWYVVSWSQDLAIGQPFGTVVIDEPVVVYRKQDGELVAFEDRCLHRFAPLSAGRCEGDRLRCMYHGLLFEPDGSIAEIPGQEQVPDQARLRRYPVAEKHSWVWVWMGDPAQADEKLIPPAVGYDNPDFVLGHGQIDYAAEARLVCDNLLDLSHLSFVHIDSFGAGDEWAGRVPKYTRRERSIRVERWMQADINARTQASEPMDRYQVYDFYLPGIFLMTGGNFPLGTGEKLGFAEPDLDDAISGVTFTSQAVSPTGPRTARYFFNWGPHRRHGDEAFRDQLMVLAGKAFAEDKAMIESQQTIIDFDPGRNPVPIKADKGVILYNRMLNAMLAEEEGATAEVASHGWAGQPVEAE